MNLKTDFNNPPKPGENGPSPNTAICESKQPMPRDLGVFGVADQTLVRQQLNEQLQRAVPHEVELCRLRIGHVLENAAHEHERVRRGPARAGVEIV